MKKCTRCKIVFHDDTRQACLYCDTQLMTTDKDDTVAFKDDKNFDPNQGDGVGQRESPVLSELFREKHTGQHLREQYVIGTYFKVRTFGFLYNFSRNQFKRGEGFNRMLAQPLNITALLTIPWAIIDFVDSFYLRMSYQAYCKKCGWKFRQVHGTQIHDAVECEYNEEYSRVVNDIISGDIAKTEGKIKQEAIAKLTSGKQSAYKDLCARRNTGAWIFDILCVWLSVCALAGVLVVVCMPFIMNLISKIEVGG